MLYLVEKNNDQLSPINLLQTLIYFHLLVTVQIDYRMCYLNTCIYTTQSKLLIDICMIYSLQSLKVDVYRFVYRYMKL